LLDLAIRVFMAASIGEEEAKLNCEVEYAFFVETLLATSLSAAPTPAKLRLYAGDWGLLLARAEKMRFGPATRTAFAA